ncbi:MAG: hypothetical protein GWN02_18920 [Gemmatimonadetes bacterium]|nr:hypothetical protein [Gemmatimonadota bacterium]NIY10219.1 hypothetical protein [Gemmatimonadota bacterium]
MLLTLILGLVLMAGAYGVLIRQDRAYSELRAATATQQDSRTGIDLLTGELREISSAGGDLVMATRDSIRFRALRKFGTVCQTDNSNKKMMVVQTGIEPFAAGDSIAVYVDRDTLMAEDDLWQQEVVNTVSTSTACTTTLGAALASLLPGSPLIELRFTGIALKYDSIYPGAPIRSYEVLTYRAADWNGDWLLVRDHVESGSRVTVPLLGPIADPRGFVLRYFDGTGTELTAFPLSAADRAAVRRIQVWILAERPAGHAGDHGDGLLTDIHLRGN